MKFLRLAFVALSLLSAPAQAQQVLGGSNNNGAPPVNSVGNEAQYYIDWISGKVWGPKSFGVWPTPPVATLSTSTTGPSGPAGGDLTGTYPNPSLIATGTAGTYGSATQVPQFTTDTKGRITGTALVTVTPAVGSITGLGTGVATALGVNVGTAGSVVVNGGALGTPSSGNLANTTGLPIGGVTGLGTGVATALGNTAGGAGGFALVGSTPPTGAAGGDLTGTYPNPTLASIISAGGPTGSATVAPIITYDAKGRLTAVSSATVTPAVGSLTGLGTGVATALGVNVGSAGSVVVNGGALGTPSSGDGTNLTNLNASNLASGSVVNARLATMLTSTVKGNFSGSTTTPSDVSVPSCASDGAHALTNNAGGGFNCTAISAGSGDVTGPASSTADGFVLFNGATGKIIKDAGYTTVPVASGGTGDTGTAWTSAAATLACGAGSLTSATGTFRYKTLGKTVFIQLKIVITTVGTCSGNILATLPGGLSANATGVSYPGSAFDNATGAAVPATVSGTTMVLIIATPSAITYYASGVFEAT